MAQEKLEVEKLEKQISFSFIQDIDRNFKATKILLYVVMGSCILITLFALYYSYDFASTIEKDARKNIYILDKNDSQNYVGLQAVDKSINRKAEAKYHVTNFHKIFYTLYPDKDVIASNMAEANNYGDQSILRLNHDFEQSDYYSKIIQGNIHQRIKIDTVMLSNSRPIEVSTRATITMIRESSITRYALETHCFLVEVYRTEKNPSGYSIERLKQVKMNLIDEVLRDSGLH